MEKKLKISLIVNIVAGGILLGLVLNSTLFVEPMFIEVTFEHNDLLQSEKQACADLFDQIFYDREQFRKDNPPKPGGTTVEPVSLSSVIIDSKFGQDFRNSDCKNTVNQWGYLVEHQEYVWGHINWPDLEPYTYIPVSSVNGDSVHFDWQMINGYVETLYIQPDDSMIKVEIKAQSSGSLKLQFHPEWLQEKTYDIEEFVALNNGVEVNFDTISDHTVIVYFDEDIHTVEIILKFYE